MKLQIWKEQHRSVCYTLTDSDVTNYFTDVNEFREVVRKIDDQESVTSQEQAKYNNLVSSLTADYDDTNARERPVIFD